ncbi:MAG: NAD(P)-dependent alcohol dehydrogenase, partial [Terriglobales bacterium]
MAVKFAHALGAHEVVISKNADEMQKHKGSFDFILDAVASDHDLNAYIDLMATSPSSAPARSLSPLRPARLISSRCSPSGSPIGGIAETQ